MQALVSQACAPYMLTMHAEAPMVERPVWGRSAMLAGLLVVAGAVPIGCATSHGLACADDDIACERMRSCLSGLDCTPPGSTVPNPVSPRADREALEASCAADGETACRELGQAYVDGVFGIEEREKGVPYFDRAVKLAVAACMNGTTGGEHCESRGDAYLTLSSIERRGRA